MTPLLPLGLLGLAALVFFSAKSKGAVLPPGPPDLPGAVTVNMRPGTIWKVVGYTDPGIRLQADVFAGALESMGHKLLKFIPTDQQGFGYTVQVGKAGLVLKVPSYDPPLHITSAQQAEA